MRLPLHCLAVLLATALAAEAGDGRPWDRAAARQLLERAGLGPSEAEVERALAEGRAAAIERLLSPGEGQPFRPALAAPELHGGLVHPRALAERLDRRREGFVELCSDHVAPLYDFGNDWAARMLAAEDPLRDRLTLFWHGLITSSFRDVGDAWKMIGEISFLRAHAFDRFEVLLRGIARDPAMLQYLNNNKNVAEHPNENWARELLELFTLGDGNYTEHDIREVARAFTGWADAERRFCFRRAAHDFGQKAVLGVHGELDGDHVIDVLLEQPACAAYLARKLLVHFEGVEPDAARLGRMAGVLRASGYDLRDFLRQLLLDPGFLRADLCGRRVLPPIEYCVSLARRSGLALPGTLLFAAADLGGQRIFFPPSVKGWEGGLGWITAGTLLARSNACAMLLGLLDARALVESGGDAELVSALLEPESNQALTGGLPLIAFAQRSGWKAEPVALEGLGRIADGREAARRLTELFWSCPPSAAELERIAGVLRALRGEGVPEAQSWRRAAHYVLSLSPAHLD